MLELSIVGANLFQSLVFGLIAGLASGAVFALSLIHI